MLPGMIFIAAFLMILGANFSFPSPSRADIYRFEDEEGVVHFTNVPTDGRYKVVLREKRVQFNFNLGTQLEKYDSLIAATAEKYNVDYSLVKAVIKAESNFNHRAVSRAGARGLMQLMPATAYALGVNDSFHPEENIEGGVRYLRYLLDLFKDNLSLALAAYNAGENAVIRYKGIPPFQETQTYVRRVLDFFRQYSSQRENSQPPSN